MLNSDEMHVLKSIKMTLSQSRRERLKEMNVWVIEYRMSNDRGWRMRLLSWFSLGWVYHAPSGCHITEQRQDGHRANAAPATPGSHHLARRMVGWTGLATPSLPLWSVQGKQRLECGTRGQPALFGHQLSYLIAVWPSISWPTSHYASLSPSGKWG